MVTCHTNGTCFVVKNRNVLTILVEFFEAGSPFSAFLLAAEICLCLTFFASIPNTRKDSIFGFLAIVFAPFIVKTVVEVAFFISIYFYTSAYTFWSYINDIVVSFCYSSFLFNFQYGIFIYSLQSIRVAVKKSKIAKCYTRWPYFVIFLLTLVQSVFFWQIMILGVASVILVLVLAPIAIFVSIIAAIVCKTDQKSDKIEIRNARTRMLWNIPCLLLSMSDSASQIYLTTQPNSYENNTYHYKDLLFSILFPAIASVVMFLTLPSLRRAIFPCFYNNNALESDKVFLLPRNSISGSSSVSPSPSERSSINGNQPIVTYPTSYPNSVVPYNSVAPMYPYFSIPAGQQQEYQIPQGFPQGSPMFVPIPMTFYNPHQFHIPHRPSELPTVQ